jgi:chromosome segregation ATPase
MLKGAKMENLNAEQIKCGLEHCTATGYKCEECPYFYKSEGLKSSMEILMTDALALITSQEQRIGELEAECEQWRSDWEKNQKQWEISYDKLESENARLTEENEELIQLTKAFEMPVETTSLHRQIVELKQEHKKELERIKFDFMVARASLMDMSTKVKELTEKNERLRADTVREMHFEIQQRCIKSGIYPAFVARTIDQIAQEMLEGENEN